MYERHRFKTDLEDYRPVTFPPPGPYWCTGETDDHSVVVAYLPKGRIVGISRYLSIPSTEDFFGFKTGGVPEHSMPFGSGVFYAGAGSSTTFALSDSAYRQLIYFKAFANIARADIPTLNRLVNKLFSGVHGLYIVRGYVVDGYFSAGEEGRAYVQDLGSMQMRYVFDYDLNVYETAIVNTPGLLPHPAGVKVFIG